MIEGIRCIECGYVAAGDRPRCPACRGRVQPAQFGSAGVVWSSTVVRVPVADRPTPYGLAYVDLVGGPRVLAHTEGDRPAPVGARVRVVSVDGEIRAEVLS